MWRRAVPRTATPPAQDDADTTWTRESRTPRHDAAGQERHAPGLARRVARRLLRASSIGTTGPHPGAPMGAATARALVDGLRSILTVTYVPLDRLVAVLDTTSSVWSLHLDPDSPAKDQCWAMIDVLRVLRLGPGAARHARSSRPLPR